MAVLLFMVWGDDGPVLKNVARMALVVGGIGVVIVVGQWMSTYGN